ncbi:MAG TPA: hypothetical protein VMM36_03185 [Opitutaceae bacterium]|nr:hypothetical protein [Opitutaceae bacterium]
MDKPNLAESVQPCSGQYSFKKDLRLNAWFFVAAVVYLGMLFLLKQHPEWSRITRGLLTLTPLIPGMLYLRSCLRFVRGMDELQRRIQMEAWLFAALGALIIGTVINTLNAEGVPLGGLKHGLSIGGAFTLTFVLWVIASVVANRRYK